jgi:GntR family transcriptional regulator
MKIEPASPVPIFQQIADGIRSAVAAGVYRPGELIPSVRTQAVNLLVNPNTVQRAYEQLEREGLIQSKKGTGMVVAPDSKVAAQNGVEEGIHAAFSQAIGTGSAAGMSRTAIDRIYRKAWEEKQGTADERR